MNTKTALVARSCRLRKWADMILECRRRPEYMSVKQWCEEHSITVANYYYRMKEVRKACLDTVSEDAVDQMIISVPQELMSASELQKDKTSLLSETLELTCGNISICVNDQTSMELLSKVLRVAAHVEWLLTL